MLYTYAKFRHRHKTLGAAIETLVVIASMIALTAFVVNDGVTIAIFSAATLLLACLLCVFFYRVDKIRAKMPE